MTTETSVYDLQPSWLRGQCLSNGLPSDVAAMLRIFKSFTDSVNETLFVLTEHVESGTASIVLDALYHQSIDTAGIYQRWSEATAQEESVDDHADYGESEGDEPTVEQALAEQDVLMRRGLLNSISIFQGVKLSEVVEAARALDTKGVRKKFDEAVAALKQPHGTPPKRKGRAS